MKLAALLPIAICALAVAAQDSDTLVTTATSVTDTTSTSFNPTVVSSLSSVASSALSSVQSSLGSQISSFSSAKSSVLSAASSAIQSQLNPTQTTSSAKSVHAEGGVFIGASIVAGLLAAIV